MKQFYGAVSGLRQFRSIGCRSSVSDRQLVGLRQSVLNDRWADGSIMLRKNNAGSVGDIEMAEREPE